MRTATLEQPGRFILTQSEQPGAPAPNEVLVRVLTVGICGTDLHAFEGTQPFFNYPRILGHELAVEVIEAGELAGDFKPGDLCAVNPYVTCGECVACRRGRTNCCAKMCVIGVHADGGMRDRILLPGCQLYKCRNLAPAQIPLVETLGVGIHAVGRAEPQAGRPRDRNRRGPDRALRDRVFAGRGLRYRRRGEDARAARVRRAPPRADARVPFARGSAAGRSFVAGLRLHR